MALENQQQHISSKHTWYIGLDPWILADGNYWNGEYHGFYQYQSVLFALELYPRSILSAPSHEKRAIHQHDTNYVVSGEVVFTWEHGWILDFGLWAYIYHRSKPPHLPELHSFVIVESYLGIDHFAYYQYLYKIPGIPPLLYHWHIQGITRNIFPLVRKTGSNRRDFFTRDLVKPKHIEQKSTQIDSSDAADQALFPSAEQTDTNFSLACQPQSLERQYPVVRPR